MIPNELIDRVLDKTDVVELIAAYIPLKKSGQNFKACCPFHEEKTPSFMVSPAKQIYHCFGCGAGGNAIGFLMNHEKMDFVESVRMLAEKSGLNIPRQDKGVNEKSSFAEALYGVNDTACKFYQENLAGRRGREAYEYFVGRGINERTAKLFRLGFAENSWQGLIEHSKKQGLEPDVLAKAGLILQNEKTGNWYDRFRNRIMFPIFDQRSKILGFGARAMDDSLPKYLNSPETCIYKKGTHLYGLNFSKESIRKQDYAIIVEGYFDLILLYQNEIRNVVATLGTALTTEQIGKLKRFTRNVIMIYDADKAGEAAMLKGMDLLIAEEMNVRIAVLPKGSDPDSFVRRESLAGVMKVLKGSYDLFDYKMSVLLAKFKAGDARGKARIVEGMLPTLSKIKNAVLKSAYLKKLSEALAVDEESIRAELKKIKPDFSKAFSGEAREGYKRIQNNLAEVALLALALESGRFAEKIKKDLGFEPFKSEAIVNILKKILELHKDSKKVTAAHLMSCFADNANGEIISEAASLVHTIDDRDKALEDCFRHIRKHALQETLNNIQFKIKDAERANDFAGVNKLVVEYNELLKGKKAQFE